MIVLEKLKQSIPEKIFKFDCKEEHLFVNADDVKFFQIVHNLLSNSIKFTKDKGIIKTTIRNHKTKVEIIIEDNGIGIPEDLQPYIFDKNTRAARRGLRGEGSIGIGLYVIKKLTERMNAKVSFTSKENKGTTFVLELPKE